MLIKNIRNDHAKESAYTLAQPTLYGIPLTCTQARKNPCDRRALLWFVRLLFGLMRKLFSGCCAGGAGSEGGTAMGPATVMADGAETAGGRPDSGVTSNGALRKYGRRWRKRAASNHSAWLAWADSVRV